MPVNAASLSPFNTRWWIWLVRLTLGITILLLLLIGGFYLFGYTILKSAVESPTGTRLAGEALGKSIKVDGSFSPLHLQGWTIRTDQFRSIGWPGEALGSLDADTIQAEFDPAAILDRAWRFKYIHLDHAVIHLLKPNDALKRPVAPKKLKPLYAAFLPDHFDCGPIISEDSDLDFIFQGLDSGIHQAHIQANLVGKDLKYTATSGQLDFPYLPPLQIKRLEILVTRPSITVYTAQLTGLTAPDPARLSLSGKIGMREDKSIDAQVEVTEMSIEKIIPENLRSLIHGKISGKLVWHRDYSGENILSEGDVQLTDASLTDLSVFKELAQLHDNPDLQDFTFDQARCHFRLQDGVLTLDLRARVSGKFDITGTVSYALKTKMAQLDLNVNDLPLKIWLPREFKPRYAGTARAKLKWQGQLESQENSNASITLNFDGTHISNPIMLRKFLTKIGFQAPEEIRLDKAQFQFDYQNKIFKLTRAELVAPGILRAQIRGQLSPGKVLETTLDWQDLVVQNWLPPSLQNQFAGNLNGHATLMAQNWKFNDGSYGGEMHLVKGRLTYTPFQSLFARFVNQPSLLIIPLTKAQFSWSLNEKTLQVSNLDVRGAEDLGVKGDFSLLETKDVKGVLWIGLKPRYLDWLPNPTSIFTRQEEGLIWAPVHLSGTVKKPEQDLTPRILAQLRSHPLALVNLGAKLLSWYVGNLFDEDQKWKPAKK